MQTTMNKPDTGYPLNDVAYDLISVLYQKSKALEVYGQYIDDVEKDNQLRELLMQIREEDYKHVQQLQKHLGRILTPDWQSPRSEKRMN